MLQRDAHPQRRRRAGDPRVHGSPASTTSARPTAYNHYAVGWAHAMDTPYQWTKQVASHWGGTRNGTIVHWPNGIAAKGEVRHQFHHVIDVAPTVLEAAGLPEPTHRQRRRSRCRCEGVSMRYAFDDADAPERHETQYFEMFCNRGIYHNGWTAVTRHSTPWVIDGRAARLRRRRVGAVRRHDDWTQAHDLAAEQPEQARRAAAAVPDRGGQVQRAAPRRPPRRAVQLRPRRPAHAGPGQPAAAVRRAWAGSARTRCSTSRTSPTPSPPRSTVPDGGADGRDRRPGRRLRRLEPLRSRRAARLLLQPVRAAAVQGRTATRPSRPGDHQVRDGVRLRRRRARQGRHRHPLRRRRQGRRGAGRAPPCRWSSRPTRPPTSAATPPPRSATTTAPRTSAFTGRIHWVQTRHRRAPTTTTTSSPPRSASASPWPGSRPRPATGHDDLAEVFRWRSRQSRRVPDLGSPRTPPRSGRHRGGQLLAGTGVAHRPAAPGGTTFVDAVHLAINTIMAQRLLVLGHDRRAGPAGAGRCWRPWVCLRSCRVGARLSGARTTIRSAAGPDQDLHDRQEHDHEQQRPDQP